MHATRCASTGFALLAFSTGGVARPLMLDPAADAHRCGHHPLARLLEHSEVMPCLTRLVAAITLRSVLALELG